jgi:hypothetical protein
VTNATDERLAVVHVPTFVGFYLHFAEKDDAFHTTAAKQRRLANFTNFFFFLFLFLC